MKPFKINNWEVIQNGDSVWIMGEEVGKHLEYRDPSKAIRNIYSRNKDAFIEGEDTTCLNLRRDGKTRDTRIYSEKGVLKLIQYSNQKIARKIMDEVFKVFIAAKKNQLPEQKPQQQVVLTGPQIAASMFESNLRIAELIQVPKSFALIETTKMVEKETGLDYTPMIQNSPLLDVIPDKDVFLEPSDIGNRLGVSGKDINKFLRDIGWQKRVGKTWEPSAYCLNEKYCLRHNWKIGFKSGYNWKWSFQMVQEQWDKQ
jgi:hypothetical protein